jgi:hypothetical protein
MSFDRKVVLPCPRLSVGVTPQPQHRQPHRFRGTYLGIYGNNNVGSDLRHTGIFEDALRWVINLRSKRRSFGDIRSRKGCPNLDYLRN